MKEEIDKYSPPEARQIDLTIQEAFTHLLTHKCWWKGTYIPMKSAASYKREFRNGTISEKTMRNILEQAGYKDNRGRWTTPTNLTNGRKYAFKSMLIKTEIEKVKLKLW